MNRNERWALGTLALACMTLVAAPSLEGQTLPTAETPIILTSCGQSPGPSMVKVFLGRLGLDHEALDMATAQDLKDRQAAGNPVKSLIIVTGASLKGMGAAGVAMPDELARTEALIAEAKRQGITIIGSHVEGMSRRAQGAAAGDNSDEQSIDAVMPFSDVMVIRSDGDEDRRFSIISEGKGIPLILFEKNMEMGNAFGSLFKK